MTKGLLKLDIGCGQEKHDGYFGVDIVKLPGVDLVCDISQGLPFEEGSVREILISHVLEHIHDLDGVMKEFHRTLAPGGIIKIFVPHCFSAIAFGDPTHCRFFTYETFAQYDLNHPKSYYRDFGFKFVKSHIQPYHRWYKPNLFSNFLEWLINLNQRRGERLLKILPYRDWEIYTELRRP